jgi:tRNA modification GTPase
MLDDTNDTIVALATAAGRGGVGIVRISGSKATGIAQQLLGFLPKPRYAHYCPFMDDSGRQIDEGLALYFAGPNSFTGEDVVEFQAHGGPIVLDILIRSAISLGARIAEPGEFSKRAFLNDKLDLVQAEAISDLINSTSEQAARSAMRSLQGAFSKQVDSLLDGLIQLRIFVEAAIDFPEEEIDFLADSDVVQKLENVEKQVTELLNNAKQGALLSEGIRVVIAGKPNAGKSSLLNALAGKDSAIVTDIAGTTRDVLKEQINIDGMPLHIIDTAGLRESDDSVEKIGIERAWDEINQADRILLVFDASTHDISDLDNLWPEFMQRLSHKKHVSFIRNKIDLLDEQTPQELSSNYPLLSLSTTQNIGLDALRQHLKECAGYDSSSEGMFTARRRHLDALTQAKERIREGKEVLMSHNAGELLAEELRLAQDALSQITGRFSADDLLGEIFGSFCIGK